MIINHIIDDLKSIHQEANYYYPAGDMRPAILLKMISSLEIAETEEEQLRNLLLIKKFIRDGEGNFADIILERYPNIDLTPQDFLIKYKRKITSVHVKINIILKEPLAIQYTSMGIHWIPSEISGGRRAEPLFLDKVQHNIEAESVRVPNQAEGLFTDFRVFSIPGLSEWTFWRYLREYKFWTVALMPVPMDGIVLLVVDPEYIWGTEEENSIKLVEHGIESQRKAIQHYIKFSKLISVKILLLCLAYEPFRSSDEKLIGSVPPEVHVLKYNLQEDFDFAKDFRAIFGEENS